MRLVNGTAHTTETTPMIPKKRLKHIYMLDNEVEVESSKGRLEQRFSASSRCEP